MRSEHTEFPQETRKELLRISAGEREEYKQEGMVDSKIKLNNSTFISFQHKKLHPHIVATRITFFCVWIS